MSVFFYGNRIVGKKGIPFFQVFQAGAPGILLLPPGDVIFYGHFLASHLNSDPKPVIGADLIVLNGVLFVIDSL